MKKLIIFFSLLIAQPIIAQTITKKEFTNTEWFSNNSDSLFFKADTIRLIKYSNVFDSNKGYKSYYESPSLKDSKSVKFQFKRTRKLNFWVVNYHMSSIAIIGERKWKMENNELVIYRNGIKEWILKPIKKNQIIFESNKQKFTTIELVLIIKR